MFTYLRSRKEFLSDFERMDEERELMRNTINHAMRYRRDRKGNNYEVQPKDFESWKTTMEKFRDIMVDMGDDIGIAFEYMMDHRDKGFDTIEDSQQGYHRRIDVMIGGRDIEGNYAMVVFEVKQYDRLLLRDDGRIHYYEHHAEDNPSKEVVEYCGQIRNDNTVVREGRIKLYPVAWLINYDPEDMDERIRMQLEDTYRYDGERVFVAYKGQEDRVKNKLTEVFGSAGRINDVFSTFREGYENIDLSDCIKRMINGGKDDVRLRADQLSCYKSIVKEIDDFRAINDEDRESKHIYVSGKAGSGKSVVALKLLKYCVDNDIKVKYIIQDAAPKIAYKLSGGDKADYFVNPSEYAKEYNINNKDEMVIIIDEAHGLFKRNWDVFQKKKGSVFIYFHDPEQHTTYEDYFMGFDHTLDSQFRCNNDDGYLSFIDDILNNSCTLYTADSLDYDFRLIRDESVLKRLIDDNRYVFVAGPKYENDNSKYIEVGNVKLDKWKIDPEKVFIKEHFDPEKGVNKCSGYKSVRGLETDRIVVIIGDDEGCQEDIHFDDARNMICGTKDVINKYRVLLSRGMRSCYVYCMNEQLRDYLHLEKRVRYVQ